MTNNFAIVSFVQEVLNEQAQLLKSISGHGCWCEFYAWGPEKYVSFIKKACKKSGCEGYEKEFSVLIGKTREGGYSISKTKFAYYPQCMDWERFLWACTMIKIIPDLLVRIREEGKKDQGRERRHMIAEVDRVEKEVDFSREKLHESLKAIREFAYCI